MLGLANSAGGSSFGDVTVEAAETADTVTAAGCSGSNGLPVPG